MAKNKQHWVWQPLAAGFFIILFLILIFYVIPHLASNNDEVEIERTNFSVISDNYDLENITYKAVDYQGNKIFGGNYYGVDGTYTKDKPLIQGEHYYTYWVKNNSYYIAPAELEIDETHRNQSVIAKAYKKVNLSGDIRVMDTNTYSLDFNEIIFIKNKDGLFDIAEFEIRYKSEERTRFPFGAVIIFEYDRQSDDLTCEGIKMRVPYFYSMQSVDSRADAFGIEEDEGDWVIKEINCVIEKYYEKTLTNNKIKITIYPNDFFLGDWDFEEEYGLILGVEDYLMNPLNKPIFEEEITIK